MTAKTDSSKILLIRLPFRSAFLPLAMEFAERGARGFGYSDRECSGLMLAVEELFSFYQEQATAGTTVEVELEDQSYRLNLSMSFRAADPDLRPFNLTWRVRPDSEESLRTLGPMIAARTVSTLRFEFAEKQLVTIRLTLNRGYPTAQPAALPPRQTAHPVQVVKASREDLVHFCGILAGAVNDCIPAALARPAMAADMVTAGRLHALLAHSGEWIVGGVAWLPLTDGNAEMFGPYLFCDDPDDGLLTALTEGVISCVSRTSFRGLLRRQGDWVGHERFFDCLGEVQMGGKRRVYYFRNLKEESGTAAYCRGSLAAFVQAEYDRLDLPRQLRDAVVDAKHLQGPSVLNVKLDWPDKTAIIRPLRPGNDMCENLAGHLRLLDEQGIQNILMEINAARSEETVFSQALEDAGFAARLLIPDAVGGDLVLYERAYGKRQT